ncbi:esterase-like activity of phytase family protein [Streptomyces cacaoi]|uniref:WD40 repeat domain-containing protein n=3 Tax=Streptomyces cacaoi TaxID=1898 RepID=A0A4Y3QW47_STRCI|nr:esterase-like activity of phytase family protein [Streptomyces cacaoi]GEB49585.1 hypothetical protein SCA03_21360 [Streptomyces cacaoi]
MSVRARAVGAGVGAVLFGGVILAQGAGPAVAAAGAKSPEKFTIEDPRITESSGLAASRAHKNIYWTHNDSDDGPYVYAVDGRTGKTVATVTLRGIDPRDVEAVSVGPDGDVYVGDIGDNLDGTWPEVWIYRFPEPEKLRDTTVTPTRYTVRYEGGPRNAESLMVHPKTGRVYIASKSSKGKGGLYAGPRKLTASGVNTFRRIAGVDFEATDGAFSPDGTRLVLRAYFSATAYRWKSGGDGGIERLGSVPVPLQRQGESVTFAPDGRTVLFGSEGRASEVEPVELSGSALPSSAREGGGGGGDGSAGSDGSDDKGGRGAGEGEDGHSNLLLAGATFAGAVVVWAALRRGVRRGRG